MKRAWPSALGAACALLAGARAAPATPGAEPPSILLVVLDDVGFEKLDWWPHQPFPRGVTGNPSTPTLRSLAAEGITFTNYWTDPVCSAARAQMLTGRNGHRTGIGEPVEPDADWQLQDEELLLPELLRAASLGFRTGAFGKWHVAAQRNTCHPLENGFEVFQGHMLNVSDFSSCPHGGDYAYDARGHHFWYEKVDSVLRPGCPSLPLVVGAERGPFGSAAEERWSTREACDDLLDWLGSLADDEPFFAYLGLDAPHEPLQVPPFSLLTPETVQRITTHPSGPFAVGDLLPCANPPDDDPCRPCETYQPSGCSVEDAGYAAQRLRVEFHNWMIEALDRQLFELVLGLAFRGRLEDTLIVVVSDNGTAQRQVDCPLNARHAKLWPYQLGARTPLIVLGPAVAPEHRGAVCDALVSAVDLYRTLAEAAGLSAAQVDALFSAAHAPPGPAPGWTLDSLSFLPLLADPLHPPAARRRAALVEWFSGRRPQWMQAAPSFRRAIVHETGFKYVRCEPSAPPGNAREEFLHVAVDPDELTPLVAFEGESDVLRPCPSGPCWPAPPCAAPGPCTPARCALSALPPMHCESFGPLCQLPLLLELFDLSYAPAYCPDWTSN